MDPLKKFPPEVVHQIWVNLEPKDLLACRAVSTHWLDSVTACDQAWFTEYSNDWYEFLAVRKTATRWTSGKVRRSTFNEIREFVFTEAAFYLMTRDGTLNMYSPRGDLVRAFKDKILSLHRGMGGLLVGVHHMDSVDTLVTDSVMNIVDTLPGVRVIQGFQHGLIGARGELNFIMIGDQILPYDSSVLHYRMMAHCVIGVQGCIDKIVKYFDVHNPSCVILKTFKANPLVIPHVEVTAGPKDIFAVAAAFGDWTKICVYDQRKLLKEIQIHNHSHDKVPLNHYFTRDFFLVLHDEPTAYPSVSCTVYPLDDLSRCWTTYAGNLNLVIVSPEPCCHMKNYFIAYHSPRGKINPHVEELYFYKVDDVHRDIICKGCVKLNSFQPFDSLCCYSSYSYCIDKNNEFHDVHLSYFCLES